MAGPENEEKRHNVVQSTLRQYVVAVEEPKRGQGSHPLLRGRFSQADSVLLKMATMSIIITFLVLTHSALGHRQLLARQDTNHVTGTSFLDHEDPISYFSGRTFLRDNIPYIDIPDKLIQDVYYYRWTSLQRNLRYVTAGTGYMCTEFVHPVGYAQAFGTIDAAAGHQIDESRWLRNTAYADDYIQLYTRGPADPLQYTQWILDATSRRSMVTGDSEFLSTQLHDMIRVWNLWDRQYDSAVGLYYYEPVWDAQELSLPGYIADPDNLNWDLRKDGPETFRPSHNAYMVANARAIARAANLAKDNDIESEFSKIANELEAAMFEYLWSPEQEFFMDVIRPNNPNLTRLTGREQVGLFPYRFAIGLNERYAQSALNSMFDPKGFLATYGPTTLEIRDPWFMGTKPDSYCCYWNGQSWPYSTSHTLKSLAEIYRSGVTNATAEQYVQYLQTYARTQQKNGRPYVAESHSPFDDTWSADSSNHSEHYDHSTNNDDVITGLLGIIPQSDDTLHISPIIPSNWTYFLLENLAYHGHSITVLYDKDGSRYAARPGLTVYVNGEQVHHGENQSAVVPIPPPSLTVDEAPINIAANPDGPGQYPTIDATFTWLSDYSYKAIDGVVYYDVLPDNRWTNYLSTHSNDTLTVHFARPRKVSSVTLALYHDLSRGGSIDLPDRIEISGSSGPITSVDSSTMLLANDVNTITFDSVETTFLAVNLYRSSETTWVGVCELEVWTPPPMGPTYFAVDAHLTGEKTRVVQDMASTATANGAVVGGVRADSNVAFSGIKSDGQSTQLTLSYANPTDAAITVSVEVNQVPQSKLTLTPSGASYSAVTANIILAKGKNYISLRGGSNRGEVRYETLRID
ncbi:Six-hairpin glycosidase-like protein [Xylaria bambusicola]|uniref:Six-hairpin glycosidase-like protein n=1 Tax=Xylaria bambusicola TaxID=326684 RepID=UPI00200800AC|nr:Six-hairpin glycosidase-like protein [Xylaria bambusicola]KAI0508909.1 Six-hairpin glycosidase-like protein [Xylaria bambusicola]